MERTLLLLGLLRMHKMHGYQINEIIEAHFSQSLDFKKPTVYHILGQMEQNGWIFCKKERSGRRPIRQVYSITPKGEKQFQQLLRKYLANYKSATFDNTIPFIFINEISEKELKLLLSKRETSIKNLLKQEDLSLKHHKQFPLLLDHFRKHLRTELNWTRKLIKNMGSTKNRKTL